MAIFHSRGEKRTRDDGLTERQPAVVGGHLAVNHHTEAVAPQRLDREPEQHVLEHAAGESDDVHAGSVANDPAHPHDDLGQAAMEPPRDHGHRHSRTHVTRNLPNERARVEPQRFTGDQRNIVPVRRLDRDRFEFDRGLRLVGDRLANADKRRDGIEEAPGAARRDTVRVPRELCLKNLPLGHRTRVDTRQRLVPR
jgi:hypothetical protein